MKQAAVIVAGGSGTRMGTGVPKQFIELLGKPIFMYSIDAFLQTSESIQLVLVMPKASMDYAQELLKRFAYPLHRIALVEGGQTRFHSVKNGLDYLNGHEIVFVHDAVRCLVSPSLIQACYEACILHGSAIPAIPVRDSIRELQADGSSSIVDRNVLRIIQTPQTFKLTELKKAFTAEFRDSFTDEASVVEQMGMKVHLIPGEESNIKITFPEDLSFATWKLQSIQEN